MKNDSLLRAYLPSLMECGIDAMTDNRPPTEFTTMYEFLRDRFADDNYMMGVLALTAGIAVGDDDHEWAIECWAGHIKRAGLGREYLAFDAEAASLAASH